MDRDVLVRIMQRAANGSLVVAAVTTVVVAPSFTFIGSLITLVLFVTAYPIFLLVACGFIARRIAAHSADDLAAPPWRAALLVGGGVTLTLTLTLLATALVLGFALTSFITVLDSLTSGRDPGGTARFIAQSSIKVTAYYLIGGLILGFPCAWFGAWLTTRSLPLPAALADAKPA